MMHRTARTSGEKQRRLGWAEGKETQRANQRDHRTHLRFAAKRHGKRRGAKADAATIVTEAVSAALPASTAEVALAAASHGRVSSNPTSSGKIQNGCSHLRCKSRSWRVSENCVAASSADQPPLASCRGRTVLLC